MKTEMDWACSCVGDERVAYRVVDGKRTPWEANP